MQKSVKRYIGSKLIDAGIIKRWGFIHRSFSSAPRPKEALSSRAEDNGAAMQFQTQAKFLDADLLHPNKPLSLLNEHGLISYQRTEATKLITIVIPYYANRDGLYNLIYSIYTVEPSANYQILIANDNPSESTFLAETFDLDNITIINNEENLGFLKNTNNAIAHVTTPYLYLVNDDCYFLTPALEVLKDLYDGHENIGVLSPSIENSNRAIIEMGAGIDRTGEAFHHDRGTFSRGYHLRRVGYVSGCAFFLSKAIWDKMGGFNELFSPGYWEDADFCLRLFAEEEKFAYVSNLVRLFHAEGGSHGTDLAAGIKKYQVSNQVIFNKFHKSTVKTGFFESNVLRDSYAGTLLFIDSLIPAKDQDSGSQDTLAQLQSFNAANIKTYFYAADDPRDHTENPRSDYIYDIVRIGTDIIINNDFRDPQVIFDNINPDVVVLSRLPVAARLIKPIRKMWPSAKIIFNTVDLHSLRLARAEKKDANPKKLARFGWLEEVRLILDADETWVVSEFERDFIRDHIGITAKLSMTKKFDKFAALPDQRKKRGVFIGSGMHTPNIQSVDALLRFDKTVGLRSPIDIYGSNQDLLLNQLKNNARSENITFKGHLPNLNQGLSQYAFGIAYLESGAGVKGKIIDYLWAGCHVIANPLAIEGFPDELVETIHIIESLDTLNATIKKVLKLPSKTAAELQTTQATIEEHFGMGRFEREIVRDIFTS
jgi:GT2 family glycosyltransferase